MQGWQGEQVPECRRWRDRRRQSRCGAAGGAAECESESVMGDQERVIVKCCDDDEGDGFAAKLATRVSLVRGTQPGYPIASGTALFHLLHGAPCKCSLHDTLITSKNRTQILNTPLAYSKVHCSQREKGSNI